MPPSLPAPTSPTAAALAANDDAGKGALEDAVRAYSDAYFKPDAAAAYRMLSTRCSAKIDQQVYKAQLDAAVKTYGHQDIKSVTVNQRSDDLARVSYNYSVPALDQAGQPWVRENGIWRYDAC
ncbi:hypothetical protein [Peterkaempfera sp. SMS 1(5)a]|uniref:hypothetical protein n=1 Tax=Peterkaempfera podocarpi TaxID=3232308 RepID=UPI00366BC1B4